MVWYISWYTPKEDRHPHVVKITKKDATQMATERLRAGEFELELEFADFAEAGYLQFCHLLICGSAVGIG
jgi:hypothetical protein